MKRIQLQTVICYSKVTTNNRVTLPDIITKTHNIKQGDTVKLQVLEVAKEPQ